MTVLFLSDKIFHLGGNLIKAQNVLKFIPIESKAKQCILQGSSLSSGNKQRKGLRNSLKLNTFTRPIPFQVYRSSNES